MSGEAISEEVLQASLRDIRLPAEAPGGFAAELAAALALAILAALLVGGLLRLVSRRRPRLGANLAGDIARTEALDDRQKRLALLHLLKTHAPERYATLTASLYRPGNTLDIATLKAALERHV